MHIIIVVRMVIAIKVLVTILERRRLVIGLVISIHHSAGVVLSYWLLNLLSILGAILFLRDTA